MNTDKAKTLKALLKTLLHEINADTYLLMEYLTPIVNGCKAAFSFTVEEVQQLHQLDEERIAAQIDSAGDSYFSKSFCFKTTDSDDEYSIVFSRGNGRLFDECVDADAIVIGPYDELRVILDPDAKVSPLDKLGDTIDITGSDVHSIVEAIGILVFPTLIKMAREGIDPSSLLAEDADSVITMVASDMVTKMVRKWIDIRLGSQDE